MKEKKKTKQDILNLIFLGAYPFHLHDNSFILVRVPLNKMSNLLATIQFFISLNRLPCCQLTIHSLAQNQDLYARTVTSSDDKIIT